MINMKNLTTRAWAYRVLSLFLARHFFVMHPSCQFCIHVRHNRFGVAVEEAQLSMQDFMAAVFIGSIIFGGCTDRIDHALCRLKDFLQHDFVAPIIPEIISVTGLIFSTRK